MLMEVVDVAPASPLPAGLPAIAIARGVRGVQQPAPGDMGGMGEIPRRAALGLVGSAPWCMSVARGEQGIAAAGLHGGVSFSGLRPPSDMLLCCA
jgi:hypothetical protein